MVKLWTQLVIVVGLMLAGIVYFLNLATPAEEATRIRNALIAEQSDLADFLWTPEAPPEDYQIEDREAPKVIREFVSSLPIEPGSTPLQKMEVVAVTLLTPIHKGGAIQSTTETALNRMMAEGVGYCSDYTQVVNGIAHILNIPVREWGMSFDGYSGYGHAFNEIFDASLGQWVFLDVHSGFYATDKKGRPLSLLEFTDKLDAGLSEISIVRLTGERRFAFPSDQAVLDYYQRGDKQLFLYWSNAVFSYDSHPVVQVLGPVSRKVEQLGAILTGVHPNIKLFPHPETQSLRENLFELKYTVLGLFVIEMILGVWLLYVISRLVKYSFRKRRMLDAQTA